MLIEHYLEKIVQIYDKCPQGNCDINGTCDNKTGICENSSYTGDKCSELCSSKFSNCNECDRNNKCLSCIDKSKYGDKCETPCFNCPGDNFCEINGNCNDSISNCDNDSYTGANCSVLCNTLTNKSNCETCGRNYTCLSCFNTNFFGEDCNNSCSDCPGDCDVYGICKDQSTQCSNHSKTGPKCDILCSDIKSENCIECNRNYLCTKCLDDRFYGDNCTSKCDSCSESRCNIQGYCHEFKCQNST